MKCFRIAFLLGLSTVSIGIGVRAQTADEIIRKWISASGGRDKISGVKTLHTEEEMTIMGNVAPSVTTIVDGKGYKNQLELNGQQVITCYTYKNGWTINPLAGQNAPVTVPPDQLKIDQLQFDIGGPLFDYGAKGNKVELLGREALGGAGMYKLKVVTGSHVDMVFFIDTSAFTISKVVVTMAVNGKEVEINFGYSNYQKTPYGWVMPFTREISFPGLSLSSEVKKVEINKEVDLGIFEM